MHNLRCNTGLHIFFVLTNETSLQLLLVFLSWQHLQVWFLKEHVQ